MKSGASRISRRRSPLKSNEISGLAWAYAFDANGIASLYHSRSEDHLDQHSHAFVWLHLDLVDMRACSWCEKQAEIPREAMAVFLGNDPHLRLDLFGKVMCGVLSDGVGGAKKPSDNPTQLRFMMGDNWLMTGRRQPSHSALATRARLLERIPVASPSALLELIVETIIDGIRTAVLSLTEEVDRIEDHVLDQKFSDEELVLGKLRRNSVRLHRDLLGYHVIFRRFSQMSSDLQLPLETTTSATRIVQRIDALHGDVHSIQERARLLQDEISSRLSADMNKNLYVLSMLSALLLPPTLIFGLFGVNVGGMPMIGNALGFVVTLLLGFVSALAVYWYLNRGR
jgi:zinc transporter